MPEKYITLKEVVKILSCSQRTVCRLMDRGVLRFYRLNGSPRFILEEIHQDVQKTASKARRRKRKVAKAPEKAYSHHPEILSIQKGGVTNG